MTSALRRDWMEAAYDAAILGWQAARLRDQLAERFGPRGLTLGRVSLPGGQSVSIHLDQPNAVYRLLRVLPAPEQDAVKKHVPALQAAVREAQRRWDAEAAEAGLPALEQRATAARDRARALFAHLPAHAA